MNQEAVMSLREENEQLFMSLNKLKKRGVIYGKLAEDEADYDVLTATWNEQRLREALAIDDCEPVINRIYRTVRIGFISKEPNALRARLSMNDMRVYTACLSLYREKMIEAGEGGIVTVFYRDIKEMLESKNVGIYKRGTQTLHDKAIKDALEDLESFRMVEAIRETAGDFFSENVSGNALMYNLLPQITFCLRTDWLMDAYEDILAPWLDPDRAETEEYVAEYPAGQDEEKEEI